MSLVLDASLTLSWYFDEESTPVTDALLDRVARRRRRGADRLAARGRQRLADRRSAASASIADYRDAALAASVLLPITLDAETDTYAWTTTLRLAERFALTVYDAAYLELAQRRSLPLATLDVPLRVAAGALGLSLLGTTG